MKSIWGAIALGCLITTPAAAQDCPASKSKCAGEAEAKIAGPVAPATTNVADDEEKEIRELEKELNKVLLVDESGKIVLREEVKGMLPIPAERVEAMLGTFVELGKDGKIKVKDIEMVRPYLPMIRRFLKQGGLDRLKNTRPERREAMKKMMPKAKPPTERPMREKKKARPAPRARRRRTRARRVGPSAAPQQLERRLARIERSLARIEKMMNQMSKLHRDMGRNRGRDYSRRERGERRGWGRRGRERRGWDRRDRDRRDWRRDRGDRWERRGRRDFRGMPDFRRMFERGGDMRELRRMFERFRDEFGGGGERDFRRMFERFRDEFAPRPRRDRDRRNNRRDRDDDDRSARRNMLERGNVFAKGFGKLAKTIQPEDRKLVLKAMRSMLMNANPGDMGKPDKMMDSFRKTMDDEEMQRLMKIFGEFSSTDEGHALQQELSRIGSDVEGFMSSVKGEQLGRALKRFQKQLGGDERLNKKIEKLMKGRRGWSRSKRAREGKAEKKDWNGPRNPKAKLY